jgi:hypothetical protein
MALKLKLDAENHVVVQDGKPVYIDDVDNHEVILDADQMRSKIAELNTESKNHRLAAKDATEKLALLGDADPAQVAKILATFTELGGEDGISKLKEKGKVDIEAIKKSVTDAYEGKLTEANGKIEALVSNERKLLIGNGFATSKFLADKTLLPADVAEAYFGKNFKIEDGRVVAYLGENKIYSRSNPGEPATIDEALMEIVDKYPMKDRILKAPGGGGGAGGGGGGGHQQGANVLPRGQFESLAPAAQMKHIQAGGTVGD